VEDVKAQRAITDARLLRIPGAGHLVFLEQPDVGTAAITEFIRGSRRPSPEARATLASGTCA